MTKKKRMDPVILIIIILSVLCLAVFGAIIYMELTLTPQASQATEATKATQAIEPTESTAQATKPEQPAPPQAMSALLSRGQVTTEQLAQAQCNQLITVESDGNRAKIRFFTCTDGVWKEETQLACSGFLGRNGVSARKREGDGCTPTGLYSIGYGFYRNTAPKTGLETFQITQETYWVDDPQSIHYNQRIEGTETKDWNSAEHMMRYSEYEYGFVVNYNTEAVPGAGSAIFFHINDNPTAGCIATTEEMVLAYLAKLNKSQSPYILIL